LITILAMVLLYHPSYSQYHTITITIILTMTFLIPYQAMFKKPEGHKHSNFAWQEYSPQFPHKQYTLGFAGRPSGSSALYISTLDNTDNHGPGSQGSKTEADATLGKLASAESIQIVKRMLKQKGGKPAGFVNNPNEHIRIMGLRLIRED